MEFIVLIILTVIGWFIWITASAASSSRRVRTLSEDLKRLQNELRTSHAEKGPEEAAPAQAPLQEPSLQQTPVVPEEPKPAGWGVRDEAPAAIQEPSISAISKDAKDWFEKAVGTRWSVWVGAFALGLGAIFLVQYTVQQGYFGPSARIFLGTLLATALLAVGEAMRRRPTLAKLTSDRSAQIPPMLTATGIVAAYATVYSAYALYGMIGSAPTFILLGVISVVAMLLASLHASYVGAIGLLGSVLAPALVSSESPQPEVLFLYLTFVLGAALTMSELRQWLWLTVAALAASIIWPLIWIVSLWQAGDEIAIGLHLLALYLFYFFWPTKREAASPDQRRTFLTIGSSAITGALIVFLLFAGDYSAASLTLLAAYALASIAVAWRWETFINSVAVSAPITILGIAFWSIPRAAWDDERSLSLTHYATMPLAPEAVSNFILAAALTGALYAVTGYIKLLRGKAHAIWAAASAFVPLLLFAITYGRVVRFEMSVPWALVSLMLALLCGAVTKQLNERLDPTGRDFPVACYATSTLSFLALTFAIVFRNEWLTIALALLVPGLAWIQSYLPVRMLERLALAMGGIVVIRLVLNPSVASYDIGATPILNALLYTYGAPTLLLAWGAWLYRKLGRDAISDGLEIAALLLGVILLNLEIAHAYNYGQAFTVFNSYTLAQHGFHLIAWLFTSLMLYRRHMEIPRAHYKVGASLLRWMSYVFLFIGLTVLNPLFSSQPIFEPLFFDSMLIAYLVPAALIGLYAFHAKQLQQIRLMRILGFMSLIAGFVYYSLEIRRLFHSGSISLSVAGSEAESYAYSAAWLILGGALLLSAFLTQSKILRLTSMAVVMLVIAKVFLFDMAGLTGILRAASFLGLGAALMGIGFFYQRIVFRESETS